MRIRSTTPEDVLLKFSSCSRSFCGDSVDSVPVTWGELLCIYTSLAWLGAKGCEPWMQAISDPKRHETANKRQPEPSEENEEEMKCSVTAGIDKLMGLNEIKQRGQIGVSRFSSVV